MMKTVLVALLLLAVTTARAATPLPPELLGIWATPDSELQGDAVRRGEALYLDTDGVGAIVGASADDVLGARIVVTSYDPASNVIGIDATEHGKVIAHVTLRFDRTDMALVEQTGAQRYYRRASQVSATIRKALGLEPRSE